MRTRRRSDRLVLLGAILSLLIALVGIDSLRARARPVDVITVVAGIVGAVVSIVSLIVRRRRARTTTDTSRVPPT